MQALDQYWAVRAKGSVRGAAAAAAAAAAPRLLRDRVRARNDRDSRDLPRLFFTETTMTACLISLALAGLIAVAVCDALL